MQTALPPDLADKPHLRRIILTANRVIRRELGPDAPSPCVEWAVATEGRAVRLSVKMSVANAAPCEARFSIRDFLGDMSGFRTRLRPLCRQARSA